MFLFARAGAVVTVVLYMKSRGTGDAQEAMLVPFAIYWTVVAVTLIWMIDAVVRRGNVSRRRGSRLALTPGARTPPPSWVGQRPRPTARVGRTGRVAYWSRVTGDGDALKRPHGPPDSGGGWSGGPMRRRSA
jgi:hypothetical protein